MHWGFCVRPIIGKSTRKPPAESCWNGLLTPAGKQIFTEILMKFFFKRERNMIRNTCKCILGTRFSPMVQPSTRTEWFGRRPSQWLQRRRGPVQDKDILMAEMEQNWWNVWTYNKFWADRVLVGVLAGALNLHERRFELSKISTEQSVVYICPGVMCSSSE